jgi:hypothetical protein
MNKKGSSLSNRQNLVEFETNKYIHSTYHHKKHIDRYDMDCFFSILNNPNFNCGEFAIIKSQAGHY